MQRFKELFEAYGADYESTMERFMGSEEIFKEFLDMLFEDENLQRLGSALAEEDLPAAFEAAHTLKGVVGNMGLVPLYEAVCAIVEPLRKEEPCRDYPVLYKKILAEFQAVAGLRKHLTEEEQA